jgi:hypothetical protein
LHLAGLLASAPPAFRRKLHDFLLRRGFDYDVVRQVVSQLEQELRAKCPELTLTSLPERTRK